MAAIKIIKLEANDDFSVIQQEILMMKDCRHANIVAFFGSYLRRDKLWICMEFCGGGSMQDIYHVTGPLNELQIAFVCRETLKGLSYLHFMGMFLLHSCLSTKFIMTMILTLGKMHRDIKGANILLTEEGEVKLADFGVSAQITATINKRRSFIGTPYWMAPEVAAVERKGGYNQQCDIWAVGITAIELAELQPPMFDLHPMRALFLMSKSGFKPPTLKEKTKWSANFHHFVKTALTKNPKKRPPAERLLMHQFLQGTLSRRLVRELLEKARNPHHFTNHQDMDPEDEIVADVPQRIANKTPNNYHQERNDHERGHRSSGHQRRHSSGGVSEENSPARVPIRVTEQSRESLIEMNDHRGRSLLDIVNDELMQRGQGAIASDDTSAQSVCSCPLSFPVHCAVQCVTCLLSSSLIFPIACGVVHVCIKMYYVPKRPPLPPPPNGDRWINNGVPQQSSSRHYSNHSPLIGGQMMSISHPSPSSSTATTFHSPRVSRKRSQQHNGSKKHVIERRNSEILLPDWRLQTVVRIRLKLVNLVSFVHLVVLAFCPSRNRMKKN